MAGSFDPYSTWLGISDSSRPLNLYHLLGLEPGEGSADIISAAVQRQIAKLQPHVAGEQGRIAKRTLIELESARLCLTNPETKAAYDADLKIPAPKSASELKADAARRPTIDTAAQPDSEEEFSLQPIDDAASRSVSARLRAREEQQNVRAPARADTPLPQTRVAEARAPGPAGAPAAAPTVRRQPTAQPVAAPATRELLRLDPLSDEVASQRGPQRPKGKESPKQLSPRHQLAIGLAGGLALGIVCLSVFLVVRQARQLAAGPAPANAGSPQLAAPLPPAVATGAPSLAPAVVPEGVIPVPSPAVVPVPSTTVVILPSEPMPTLPAPKSDTAPPQLAPEPEPGPGSALAPALPRDDRPLPVPTEPFRPAPRQNPPRNALTFDPLPAKPKPAPERGPFALLPRSVELPPLAGAKLATPVSLGKIDLPNGAPLSLSLLSDIDGLKSGFRYALEPAAGERAWDVYATEFRPRSDGRPVIQRAHVARFSINDDQELNFAWHDEALSAAGSPLRNAVLQLETTNPGRAEKLLPLRSAQLSAANRLDPDRGELNVAIKGEGLPDRAVLRLALIDATGFTRESVVQPATASVAYREQLRLIIRNATSSTPGIELRFKLQSIGASAGVALEIASLVVDRDGDTLPFHQSRIHGLARTLPRELEDTRQSITELKRDLSAIDREVRSLRFLTPDDAQQARQIEFSIGALLKKAQKLSSTLADRQKKLDQQERLVSITPDLKQQVDRLQTTASFNYRVFFVCGGREVDVLTSQQAVP